MSRPTQQRRSTSPIGHHHEASPINRLQLLPRHITLRKKLGKGAQGLVYFATSANAEELGVPKNGFVIKKMSMDPKQAQTSIKEAKTHRELNHPQVVRYFGSWIETSSKVAMDNDLCIALQYCEGGDLFSYLERHKAEKRRVPNDVAVSIAVRLLCGLEYLHSKRILHRDIKPQNVFITAANQRTTTQHSSPHNNNASTTAKDWNFVLGDFGIARNLEFTAELAMSRVGTPYYVSPEIVHRRSGYTNKTDVWSLGVILYEVLTLERPFSTGHNHDIQQLYREISHYDPTSRLIERTASNLYDAWLIDLCSLCLTKDWRERPTTRHLTTAWHDGVIADHIREMGLIGPSLSAHEDPNRGRPSVAEASPAPASGSGPRLPAMPVRASVSPAGGRTPRHVSPLHQRSSVGGYAQQQSATRVSPPASVSPPRVSPLRVNCSPVRQPAGRVSSPIRAPPPPPERRPSGSPISARSPVRQQGPTPSPTRSSSPAQSGTTLTRTVFLAVERSLPELHVHGQGIASPAHAKPTTAGTTPPPSVNDQLVRLLPNDAYLVVRIILLASSASPPPSSPSTKEKLRLVLQAWPEVDVDAVIALAARCGG